MKKINLLLTVCLAGMCSKLSWAVPVNSIYFAEVPVTSQSAEERSKAEQEGLKQVLIKVSGDDTILDDPWLKNSMNHVEELVQEFSYASNTLHVKFEKEAVNSILKDAGIPIWGENRPLIVAWIDDEESNNTTGILSNDTVSDLPTLLIKTAEEKGLPIILPVMDAAEMEKVNLNDIIAMNTSALSEASKRYDAEAILIAHILKTPMGFTVQSKMVMEGNEWRWDLTGATKENIISQLLTNISDTLAGRYAIVGLRSKIAKKDV